LAQLTNSLWKPLIWPPKFQKAFLLESANLRRMPFFGNPGIRNWVNKIIQLGLNPSLGCQLSPNFGKVLGNWPLS